MPGSAQRRRNVAETETLTYRVAMTAGGGHPHAAVADKDRLSTLNIRIARVEAEVDQLQRAVPFLQGVQGRFPADEVALVELDEALHGRVDQGHFVGQFHAPTAVGLFQPQTVDRVEAEIANAEFCPGCHERVIQGLHVLHGRVQFPAEFADIVHAQCPHRHPGDVDFLSRQPAKGAAVQGRVRQFGQHRAGVRSGQYQHAAPVGDIGDVHLLSRAPAVLQVVEIAQLGAGGGEHVESLIVKLSDRHFRADAPALGQEMGKCDAPALRYPVGAQPIQHRPRIAARHVVLCKSGKIQDTDPLAHGQALFAHQLEYVVVAKAVLFLAAVRREPLGPLPAKGLGIHAALGLELVVQRAGPAPAGRWQFFPRQRRGVGPGVVLATPGTHVAGIGEHAEAPGIEAGHVDFGVAM